MAPLVFGEDLYGLHAGFGFGAGLEGQRLDLKYGGLRRLFVHDVLLSWRDDRADLLRSGRAGLAIQVEHPA